MYAEKCISTRISTSVVPRLLTQKSIIICSARMRGAKITKNHQKQFCLAKKLLVSKGYVMKITKIWFTADHIFGRDEEGKEYSQSLLWYPKLRTASDDERSQYTFGYDGIHWRSLDEDISFESFTYEDSEPSALQRFFLTHKEINVAEFARSIGMNATLLRNYINGFKKPSAERESEILAHIHKLGKEMIAACF